jgi:SAM-dependent methyltransferase
MRRGEWERAQRGELDVWKTWGDEPVEALRHRAEMLGAYCRLDVHGEGAPRRLLEIGAAGAPVISFLPADHRIYVDPLFGEIRELFARQFAADQGTSEFHSRPAEDLAFIEDRSIDLAFCLNVLDHTRDPLAILRQLHMKLGANGRLLLSVDCYSRIWLGLRSMRVILRGKNQNDIPSAASCRRATAYRRPRSIEARPSTRSTEV